MDVCERVSRVLVEQFRVERSRIIDSARIDEDLCATSLDRVEVVMALEDEFAIDISDAQAGGLHTVADVVACVNGNLVGGRPALPDMAARDNRR